YISPRKSTLTADLFSSPNPLPHLARLSCKPPEACRPRTFLMDPRLLLLAATLWQPAAGVDQYGDPLPKGGVLRGAPQRPSLTSTPQVAPPASAGGMRDRSGVLNQLSYDPTVRSFSSSASACWRRASIEMSPT